MRAALPWLFIAAAATIAAADPKHDVEALVRAEAQIVDEHAKPPEQTDDAVFVQPLGTSSSIRMNFYGGYAQKVLHKVDKLVVGIVDPHTAWFHAVVIGTIERANCDSMGENCGRSSVERVTWRLSGVAVDKGGWKIAAAMWSRALPDADLFKLAVNEDSHDLTMDPHDEAAKLVAGWFAGSDTLARSISSSASASANGTAPGEIGQGAAAAKLAKVWDSLKMWTTRIEGKQWGSVAFVHATVGLPTKKLKTAVMMKLGVVLVKENNNWRWAAINFAPPDR